MKTKLLVTALIAALTAFAGSAFASASYSSQDPVPIAQRHEVKQGGYRSAGGVASSTAQSGRHGGPSPDQVNSLYRGS